MSETAGTKAPESDRKEVLRKYLTRYLKEDNYNEYVKHSYVVRPEEREDIELMLRMLGCYTVEEDEDQWLFEDEVVGNVNKEGNLVLIQLY